MGKWVEFTSAQNNPGFDNVEDVFPDEVRENKANLLLIDVREPEEYVGELGHVEGAKLISLGQLPDHLESLPHDQTIVFICRSGARSAHATAMAKDRGCESVYNMKGGMLLWNQMGLEVERS